MSLFWEWEKRGEFDYCWYLGLLLLSLDGELVLHLSRLFTFQTQ